MFISIKLATVKALNNAKRKAAVVVGAICKERMRVNVIKFIVLVCFVFPIPTMAEKKAIETATYTLWSDSKNCYEEGAYLIAIESGSDSYKVAACAPGGCRVAVKEFGKRSHSGDFRNDPKFTWASEVEFEAEINGGHRKFYLCHEKKM